MQMSILHVALLVVALSGARCNANTFGRQNPAFLSLLSRLNIQGIPCLKNVQYTVVNDCNWNADHHPTDYPSSAHWSPLCGTTHKSLKPLFRVGGIASDGVREVAETGDCSILRGEVAQCGKFGACGSFLSYPCSAMDGTCRHSGIFDISLKRPHLSLVSMVAPSPDWFVGVDSVNLCKNGFWVPKYETYLFGNDAGTDSGATFLSPDMPMVERALISVFNAQDASNIFYNRAERRLYPLCKITITLNNG